MRLVEELRATHSPSCLIVPLVNNLAFHSDVRGMHGFNKRISHTAREILENRSFLVPLEEDLEVEMLEQGTGTSRTDNSTLLYQFYKVDASRECELLGLRIKNGQVFNVPKASRG
ncbi:hypothetical protein J6590_003490 [Homalodisca vitripennis]|nr:hypothetical protein J6590_003490 [Homalodisca vitripennis]